MLPVRSLALESCLESLEASFRRLLALACPKNCYGISHPLIAGRLRAFLGAFKSWFKRGRLAPARVYQRTSRTLELPYRRPELLDRLAGAFAFALGTLKPRASRRFSRVVQQSRKAQHAVSA